MIVANFNLSTNQMRVLIAFRAQPDSRKSVGCHGAIGSAGVTTLRKLCAEGYLDWHDFDPAAKTPPGYTLTPKGEMLLRVIEEELKRNLAMFGGADAAIPSITGAKHDVAAGKAEITPRGRYRRRKGA